MEISKCKSTKSKSGRIFEMHIHHFNASHKGRFHIPRKKFSSEIKYSIRPNGTTWRAWKMPRIHVAPRRCSVRERNNRAVFTHLGFPIQLNTVFPTHVTSLHLTRNNSMLYYFRLDSLNSFLVLWNSPLIPYSYWIVKKKINTNQRHFHFTSASSVHSEATLSISNFNQGGSTYLFRFP